MSDRYDNDDDLDDDPYDDDDDRPLSTRSERIREILSVMRRDRTWVLRQVYWRWMRKAPPIRHYQDMRVVYAHNRRYSIGSVISNAMLVCMGRGPADSRGNLTTRRYRLLDTVAHRIFSWCWRTRLFRDSD